MLRKSIWLPLFVALLASIYPVTASSQTVSVQNGLGQYGFGWMFGRSGTCYIVMPRHVAGPFPRVTISTAAPVQTATATVIAPFWDGIDLALGVARGTLSKRCTAELDDLAETRAVLTRPEGDLLRLTPTGEETRTRLRILDRTYLTFTAALADGGTDIAQGTSGSFLFIDGHPAGMAITSDDTTRGLFMRSGEILIHLRRFLDEQGGAYDEAAEPRPAEPRPEPGALPLRFLSTSVPPVTPVFAPENMTGDGQFVFHPQRRMSLIFGFDKVRPVSRIVVRSTPSPSQTSPKSVLLRWSLDEAGQRFGAWYRGEMGPDGILDTGRMAPRNVRHLEVLVLDTWSAGDVVIDSVAAY